MHNACFGCKGKLVCGRPICLVYSEAKMFGKAELFKEEFNGNSPPGVFVGSKMYPNLNVGILSPPEKVENAWVYDSESYWAKEGYSIRQILNLRGSLINSRFNTDVKSVRNGTKFLDIAQEIGMASKPVGVEIELVKKVKVSFDFDSINSPMGPRAGLKKVRLTENPKILTKVDKVVSDSDLKAAEAIKYLYANSFEEQQLIKLLSIGVLGLKKNRKLVPTRWCITCVDDTIGKELMEKIKDYKSIDEHMFYFGSYLGNYYCIMFFPDVFNYELFEMYMPNSAWNPSDKIKVCTDSESVFGRKNYASNTVGGYYSSRLAILEFLERIKRQAGVLVLRFETPEYYAGLGVWVTRSAARKTLQREGIKFENKEKMLDHTRNFVINRFRYDLKELFSKSKYLESLKTQVKLNRFF